MGQVQKLVHVEHDLSSTSHEIHRIPVCAHLLRGLGVARDIGIVWLVRCAVIYIDSGGQRAV